MDGKKIREIQEQYVVKSNELIQKGRYNLTVQQQKLVLYAISKIKKGDQPDQWYELSIEEVCSVMGLKYDNTGYYYKAIKDDLKYLTSPQWVKLEDKSEWSVSWFGSVGIVPLSGTVYVKFHEMLEPHLFELVNRYTQYQLYEVLTLKGKYSIRLYELLRSYLMQDELRKGKEKEVDYSVDELRSLLCCDSYKKWPEFERCVLRKAVDEINKCSDIVRISYDTIKRGKSVVRITFIITYPTMMEKLMAHEEQRKRL